MYHKNSNAMKRIITSLVLLAAVLVGTTSWAQTLNVAGVSVDLNATSTQTITGSNIQGKVTYSPSSKTLYLEDATINGSIYGTNLGSSASTRYYIYLKGLNLLKTSSRGIRFDNSYVVLYGATGAQLQINSEASNSDFSCISTEGGHFEVWSVRLTMFGASKGFYGSSGSATLGFVNSIVSVDCDAGAIYGYKSVAYDDCKCTDNDVKFQSGTGYVNEYGQLVSSLHIWPLLVVGEEPVRTAGDTKTGSRYSWKWTKSEKKLEITGDISTKAYSTIANYGIEGLTIQSNGNYSLTSSNITVGVEKKTTISGSGKLNITSTAGNAIVARADVDVSICELNVQGKLHGFTDVQSGHKLRIDKYSSSSVYRFAGATRADIYASNLELDFLDIYTDDTYWNPIDGYVYRGNAIAKSQSVSNDANCTCFKPYNQISYYPLYVGDTQVRQNCTDHISGPGFTSGSVSYDPSTKTLTLTDATVSTSVSTYTTIGNGISNNGIEGLTIKLVGDNKINAHYDAIASKASFSIVGDGTLVATSEENHGLLLTGDITCTISGPQIDLLSQSICVDGYQGSPTLDVRGTTTKLTFDLAQEYGYTFHKIGNIRLDDGLCILEPEGAYFDPSVMGITIDGYNPCAGRIVIGRPTDYGLIIGETHVTSANADDILGDGQFSYDPSTKTLTVTNATLTNTSGALGSIISNRDVYGLAINLVGDNYFTSRMSTIDSEQTFVIMGDGTLTCKSTDYAGLYLWGDDVMCYISGPQVVFAGMYGLRDMTGKSRMLVTGSTTRVTLMPTYEAIYNLKGLLLDEGFSIIEPADGWFDVRLKSVTTDGTSAYMGTVVIGKQAQGDLNADGKVDIADAVTVLDIMASGEYNEAADINNDTKVDIADFVSVLDIMAAQ